MKYKFRKQNGRRDADIIGKKKSKVKVRLYKGRHT